MRFLKYIALTIIVLLAACQQEHETKIYFDSSITDDLGNTFELSEPPKRVVTLAPNLTEMIYALKQEDRLVGNTLYCNYPAEAENITKVGDMIALNYEILLSLKPDLVFITIEGNTKETYNRLNELGIRVFVSNPRNYEDIKKTFRQFGKIFDVSVLADSLIQDWDKSLQSIEVVEQKKRRTVLFLASVTPIIAAGQNTFINEYIKMCGLENIVKDSSINYPVFSREEILKVDPDFIIYASMTKLEESYLSDVYAEWKNLKAIKNNNVIYVDPDLFYRPGPRFVQAVKTLYTKINKP